jgi:hypothetical protein
MTFEKFVKGVTELLEAHPEASEFPVITAGDEEGNGYDHIFYGPSIGHFDDEDFSGLSTKANNAVCVN